ncbi:MAG TPA: hypothetical protein VMT59_15480 [Gaiellaceae bacterium]|nr:hypothetical protein [Gaiellaceae bacterium]
MTQASAATPAAPAADRAWPDRVIAALPLAIVFLWLCFLYAWESWGHVTPWLFSDEIKLAEIARTIAATGHPGTHQPALFNTLYAYVLAPAWLIRDEHTAYAVAKYIGAITMASVFFPAYGIARLVSSRWHALFAATAAAAIPALVYSPMFLLEPLAYPFATLVLYLGMKALLTRRPGWIAAAVVASFVAPLIRTQLAVLPAILALSAVLRLWVSGRARAWRSTWSKGDWVGFFTLLAGTFFVVSAWVSYRSQSWRVATYFSGRMFDYGLWAAGALTIGLGVLPVVIGLGALILPSSREPRTEPERAFVIVTVSALILFGLYAAVKAAYLSAVFSTLVEERNLIYLAPLLFAATALFFERRRMHVFGLVAAAGFALYLILTTPYQMQVHFYSDAPGLAILQGANRRLSFTPSDARWLLIVLLVLAVALPLLIQHRLAWRDATLAIACTAVLVIAWNLTGEISAAAASNDFSRQFLTRIPDPPDWVDQQSGRSPTLYLGQRIVDPNNLWLTEFWNRSLKYTWSLDGTAPGPGVTVTPNIMNGLGQLQQQRGEVKYVLLDSDLLSVRGTTKAKLGPWRLVKIDYPVSLTDATTGFYVDGWMGHRALYAKFASPKPGHPGLIKVVVSRTGWGGTDVPGHVTIRVGKLRITPSGDQGTNLALGPVTATRTWTVHARKQRTFLVPTPKPPYAVEVTVTPTFVPALLDPRSPDRRKLGAIVSFKPVTVPAQARR